MPRYADEPLTKITLNLFSRDVEYLKKLFPSGYTEEIRDIVRRTIRERKARDGE